MLRKTARSLLKNPGFAVASILALALGIGANTAIFSLANAVLLRPLPYKDPGRLVMLWQQPPSGGENSLSAADFQDWRDRSQSFEDLAAYTGAGFNLTGGDRPERLAASESPARSFRYSVSRLCSGACFLSRMKNPVPAVR